MTTLPERLRASAQAMRGLFLVSENVPNVRMIYKEDRDRIARELEEAAGALEVQPVAWRVRGYAQFKTGKPGPWRYVDGPERPAVNNKDCCDFEPLYAAPAQVALEAQREDRREVLRILYEAHRKTNPSPSLAAISAAIQHLQAVEDATSAQVAQEVAAGVATRTVSVDLLQRAIDALGKTNARDVWCDLRCAAGVATDGARHD